ncbi:MAG: branched-chain amino acid transporter, permease [Thermoanaerobacter sp.]|nr:branched-chain amino acid transporter, permease [Thermoanaerobacter sp.]
MNRYKLIPIFLFFILMIVFPFIANTKWVAIGTTFLIYAVVALSQDIVLGRAGMFDMGHAIFFGVGAYTTAILNTVYNIPVLWTIPAAIILPIIVGIAIATPIVHLRGDYLLVTMIGFNIVFEQVLANNIFNITGGPNGIFGIGYPSIFGFEFDSQIKIYILALLLFLLTLIIIRNLENSKIGRALHYIKNDSLAAQCVGINDRYYKLFSFALGAGIAGVAGSVFAVQYSAVSPETFNFLQSVLFFSIVIVGGPSSIVGVLLGTFIMFVLPEIFRQLAEARYFVFGIAMILAMVLRPKGLWPHKYGRIPEFVKKEY